LIYIALLVSGWTSIIYLTAKSEELGVQLREMADGNESILLFSDSVVPGFVTIINSALPIIIEKIVNFEKWDTEKMNIKQLLGRMYLAKILNVVIQAISYSLLADPFLFTTNSVVPFVNLEYYNIRKNVQVSFKPDVYVCRIDQVGAGLVQLLAVDFVVSKIIMLIMPQINMLKARLTKKDFKKDEFLVPKKMVNILYSQGLTFAALPYSPLFTVMTLVFHFIMFKFEKAMLFKYGTKPKKEFSTKDAGNFFIKFYLITIMAIALTSCYFFLSKTSFAKSCDIQDELLQICLTPVSNLTNTCALKESCTGAEGEDPLSCTLYRDYLDIQNHSTSHPVFPKFECR